MSKLMLPVKHNRVVSVQSKTREWLVDCQKRQDSGERVSFLLLDLLYMAHGLRTIFS